MRPRHVAALIALLVLWLFASSRPRRENGSTFEPHSGGALALLEVFKELGLDAERWFQPFSELPRRSAPATLFLIEPSELPPAGYAVLMEWVQAGNRLIYMGTPHAYLHFTGSEGAPRRSLSGIMRSLTATEPEPIAVECGSAPADVCRKVREISDPGPAFPAPQALQPAAVLAGSAREPKVLLLQRGKGEIWLFSAAAPALNEQIDRFDNLRLLYQIASRGAGPILFDEFHHGYTAPAGGAGAAQLGSLALLCGFLTALLLAGALSRAVRFGPPRPAALPHAAATAEFASVLGLLYRDYGAAAALKHYVRAWRVRLELAKGLSRRLPDDRLVEGLVARGELSAAEGRTLAAALREFGRSTALPDEQVAALARCLEFTMETRKQ